MDEESNTIPLRAVHDSEDHRYVNRDLHVIQRLAALDRRVPDAMIASNQVRDGRKRVSALDPRLVDDVALLVGDLRAAPRDQCVVAFRDDDKR